MVPDGYISDDEGLGTHDPEERLGREREYVAEPGAPKAAKRDSKRRYVEKQPLVVGPFLHLDSHQAGTRSEGRITPLQCRRDCRRSD